MTHLKVGLSLDPLTPGKTRTVKVLNLLCFDSILCFDSVVYFDSVFCVLTQFYVMNRDSKERPMEISVKIQNLHFMPDSLRKVKNEH